MVTQRPDLAAAPPDADASAGVLAALLQRCGAGDAAALERVYALTAPMLLGCILQILKRRALAEEALQDVFVTIWQRAAQYDRYRGRPQAWLVSIARYRAIDILRSERAIAVDPAEMAETLAAAEDDGAGDAARPDGLATHELGRLEHCLGRLTPEQARSLRLAYVDGRSHQDIATALAKPLGSIKSWIRRGLLALRECMQP